MNDIEKQNRLKHFEQIIDERMNSFMELGEAICVIHAEKLYKLTHDNFGKYISERFHFGRSKAYDIIGKFNKQITGNIGNLSDVKMGRTCPNSDKPPTSGSETPIIDAEFEAQDAPEEEYKDHEGHVLPPDLVDFFKESDAILKPVTDMMTSLKSAAKKAYNVDEKLTPKEPRWDQFSYSNFKHDLGCMWVNVRDSRPWSICIFCGGDGGVNGGCLYCDGKGWMTNKQYAPAPQREKEKWK